VRGRVERDLGAAVSIVGGFEVRSTIPLNGSDVQGVSRQTILDEFSKLYTTQGGRSAVTEAFRAALKSAVERCDVVVQRVEGGEFLFFPEVPF
jgi:hypothetical protein